MSRSERISKSRKAVPHLLVFAGLIAFAGIRYSGVFSGASIIAEPAFIREIAPLIALFQESVKAGALPLWNPYCYLGMPQLPGHFPGLFYPLNVLFLFHHNAGAVFLAVHQVVAAASVYLICVYLRKNMMARLVASICYLLLHLYIVGEQNLSLAASLSWLPLGIFGILKCLQPRVGGRPHVASLVVINSLALGLMLTAGCIALTTMLLVAAVISFVVVGLSKEGEPRRSSLVSFFTAIALSLCLGAPVLLPLKEWMMKQPFTVFVRSELPDPSISALAGPTTTKRLDYEKTRVEKYSIMKDLWSLMGHYGRYLCVYDEPVDFHRTELFSITPNANFLDAVPSAAGLRGHPTPAFNAIAASAGLDNLDRGFAAVPKDAEKFDNLIRFAELTGTKLFVAPETLFTDRESNRISNYKSLSAVLKKVPELQFYQLYGALPDAYSIDAWQWVESRQAVLERLFGKDHRVDPSRCVLIEKTAHIEIDEERLDKMPFNRVDPPKGPPPEDAPPAVSGASQLRIVEKLIESPMHIALSTKVDKPSFVVLNAASYPGWKGYVDGAPVPMYCANGIARAVFVLEGPHLVEFDYRPESVKTGCLLSISALVAEALLLFWWLLGFMRKAVNWMSFGVFE